MKKLAHVNFILVIYLLIFCSAQAQTAEIATPKEQVLIPGKIVVYFQDDITPEKAEQNLSELNLKILETDIKPVITFLSNPDKTVIEGVKNHPSIDSYHIHTFVFDSTTLKEHKFAEGMTEEQKEQARKRFLEREDQITALVTFKYPVTAQEADSILTTFRGIGEYNLISNPRTVLIKVASGTEPENMEMIQTLPFVTDVTRIAENMVLK